MICGKHRGLTASETLLVAVVGVAVALMIAGRFIGAPRQESRRITIERMNVVMDGLQLYALDNGGVFPTTEQGLRALLVRPEADLGTLAVTLEGEEVLVDGWGMPLHYICPGGEGRPYDLWSGGADRAGVAGKTPTCNLEPLHHPRCGFRRTSPCPCARRAVGVFVCGAQEATAVPAGWETTVIADCADASIFSAGYTPDRQGALTPGSCRPPPRRVRGESPRHVRPHAAGAREARLTWAGPYAPFDAISLRVKNPNGHERARTWNCWTPTACATRTRPGPATERNWRQIIVRRAGHAERPTSIRAPASTSRLCRRW